MWERGDTRDRGELEGEGETGRAERGRERIVVVLGREFLFPFSVTKLLGSTFFSCDEDIILGKVMNLNMPLMISNKFEYK